MPSQPSMERGCDVVVVAGLAIVIAAGLGGCAVGPDYKSPEVSTPEAFSSLSAGSAVVAPTPSDPAVLAAWWTRFNDPVLSDLVKRAAEGNKDLRQAAARVREARALLGVAEGDRFPAVGASGAAERSRGSETTEPRMGGTEDQTLFRAGVDASWELDFFGAVRRGVEAADADLGAAVEDERAVYISLLGDVARNYVELRGVQRRLEVTRKAVAAQQATVELIRSRFDAGLSNDLELAQSQAQLHTRESQVPPLIAAERALIHRLAILVGQAPGALASELSAAGSIPRVDGPVAVGVPADLLRRRPDIRRAERRLAAATARIGVATAELYPRFSLSGAFGLQAADIGNIVDMDSRAWSFGPSFRWRLFEGGRIRSAIRAADARTEQALLAYESTVLVAMEETENAITTLENERVRRDALQRAVTANERAVRLSEERYRSGVGDFLNVLESQRQLFLTEDDLARSESDATAAVVTLFRSLGGDWETPVPEPAGTEPTPTEPAPIEPTPVAPAAGG